MKLTHVINLLLIISSKNEIFGGNCKICCCCQDNRKPRTTFTGGGSGGKFNLDLNGNFDNSNLPTLYRQEKNSHSSHLDPDTPEKWDVSANVKSFIESLPGDSRKDILKCSKTNITNYYNILDKYAKDNKKDINNIQISKTKGKNDTIKATIEDKTIYLKEDCKYHKFYIDLLKHLNLTDLEYQYTDDYLLTEELKNITENISFHTYDEAENAIKVINKAKNLVPFFIILCFLDAQDVNLFNNSNIYFTQEGGKTIMKILDIDIHETIKKCTDLESFINVLTTKTDIHYFNKYEEEIFKSEFYDPETKKLLIILSAYEYFKDGKSCIQYKTSFGNNIKIDKDFGEKFSNTFGCFFLEEYVKSHELTKKSAEDFNNSLEKIYKKCGSDYKYFLNDFINKTWNNLKDKAYNVENTVDDNNNKIYNTVDEYRAFLIDSLDKLKEIYKNVTHSIKAYDYQHNTILRRIENMSEDEKNETINLFSKMLDWLIANKNNTKYNTTCYNKVVTKINLVQNAGFMKFLFENKEIKDKIINL